VGRSGEGGPEERRRLKLTLVTVSFFITGVGFLFSNGWIIATGLTAVGLLIGSLQFAAALEKRPNMGRGARAWAAVNNFGGFVLLSLFVGSVVVIFWQREKAESFAALFVKRAYTKELALGRCFDVSAETTSEPTIETYESHCAASGLVESWKLDGTGSQISSVPSFVVVRAKRGGKEFREIWHFHRGKLVQFGAGPP